jgi:hypothetical protein
MPPGRLFSATRAALFAQTSGIGQPQLPLTVAAITDRLGASEAHSRAVADRAYEHYRASESMAPRPRRARSPLSAVSSAHCPAIHSRTTASDTGGSA